MGHDELFPSVAEYTIDSCSLMAMFNDESWTSKKVTPGLWERVSDLIGKGIIVSHCEVLSEIKKDGKKGEELFNWANGNATVFQSHDVGQEGAIIRAMSSKYKWFVNNGGKTSSVYADPWLVAQAKCGKLKIITQETLSGNPAKPKLPNVCRDPSFAVDCLDLLQLVAERRWSFR